MKNEPVESFLSNYTEQVIAHAFQLREILFTNLPDIQEQVDLPAKMIAYNYGRKYIELVCVIIPSKKGLKLGFNRGTELPDPDNLLEGNGKISRYVVINSEKQIKSPFPTLSVPSAWAASSITKRLYFLAKSIIGSIFAILPVKCTGIIAFVFFERALSRSSGFKF